MNEPLLILGASARAAAQSARRAGLDCNAVDLFADVDLVQVCQACVRVESYPRELPDAARQMPAGPWLYTGALENYADIIAVISASRPLLGNSASVLRLVRDPLWLATTLRQAGHCSPRCAESPDGLPVDGSWLRKSRRSAGGIRVDRWRSLTDADDPANLYWQEFVGGESRGASFVAAAGQAVLLGTTLSLHGTGWGAPRPFQYAGSIGPLACDSAERHAWEAIGTMLARTAGLEGLFGLDAIVNGLGVSVIEVNPRITASLELLERAGNFSAVALHVAACREHRLPEPIPRSPVPILFGKLLVFADKNFQTTAGFADELLAWNRDLRWPVVADIPTDGTTIPVGHPIATVFADGPTAEIVSVKLREQAVAFLQLVTRMR